MILTPEEYNEFLEAHLRLLYFYHLKLTVRNQSFSDFRNQSLKVKYNARNYFHENFTILDNFLEQSTEINANQKKILTGFKQKISSDFVILRLLKSGAIFIDIETEKVYSVFALSDSFDQFFESFPVLIRTTILPFKDKIIYDGFLNLLAYIGPGTAWDLNSIYMKVKGKKMIIKNLNF
jgi:hypothetical protein